MSPRVWFITGSSSGLGLSMLELVLQKGDIAIATLRKPEVLSELSSRYSAEKLLVLKLDVTIVDEVVAAFQKAKDVFGRIDVVYNNAGYLVVSELEGIPYEAARTLFDTNLWGAVTVSREAVKFFREVNESGVGGKLLQMSSMVGIGAAEGIGFYSSAKFALEGFSEALSKELDPQWNIKVTLIEPGFFCTKIPTDNLVALPRHSAYANSSLPSIQFRDFIDSFKTRSHWGGDPDKLSESVYRISQLSNPPLRLILGQDALIRAKEKLASVTADLEKYESWSLDLGY